MLNYGLTLLHTSLLCQQGLPLLSCRHSLRRCQFLSFSFLKLDCEGKLFYQHFIVEKQDFLLASFIVTSSVFNIYLVRLGKIKCEALALAFVGGVLLFLFCEGSAFFCPFLALMFMVCTVVIALLVTFCGFKKLGISEHKTVKPPQMLMRSRMFIKPLNPQFLKPAVIGCLSCRQSCFLCPNHSPNVSSLIFNSLSIPFFAVFSFTFNFCFSVRSSKSR